MILRRGQPEKGAKKRDEFLFLLVRKLMLSTITVGLLARPNLLFSLQLNPVSAANSERIEYVVDVRQASKGILLIKAQIYGLAGSEVAFRFSNAKRKNPEIAKRVIGLSLRSAKTEITKINEAQLRLETNPNEMVEVSYKLRSDLLSNLDKGTYLDEGRCLLQSQDALFGIEDKNIPFEVSFILPSRWKAITLAKQVGQESYEFLNNKNVVFYLGEATEIRESVNNCAVSLAIEPDWSMASEDILREVKRQIIYMQSLSGDWQPQSLLAVFFGSHKDNGKAEAVAIEGAESIVLIAPQFISADGNILKDVKFLLAGKLIGFFSPSLSAAPESEFQKGLTNYLAWKACLKTGGLTKDEFLEKMAEGFYESAATPKPEVLSAPIRMGSSPLRIKLRGPLNFFLIDLALAFFGKEKSSLDEFLQKFLLESKGPQTILEGLPRSLRSEAKVPEIFLNSSESFVVTDLLRPYGLLLERRELPKFDFALSETFQIVQLPRGTVGLRLGDRILAINQNRIIKPADLFKLRSSLRLGEEATLTIDRNGSTLNLKERLGTDTFFRLAVNRLADSDKRQRLAQFLARTEGE